MGAEQGGEGAVRVGGGGGEGRGVDWSTLNFGSSWSTEGTEGTFC